MSVMVDAVGLLSEVHTGRVTMDGVNSVADAIARLPLKRSTGIVILVNGKLGEYDTPLRDGDLLELIPALGGG